MIQRGEQAAAETEAPLRQSLAALCEYQRALNSDFASVRNRLLGESPENARGIGDALAGATNPPPPPIACSIEAAHRLIKEGLETAREILNRL